MSPEEAEDFVEEVRRTMEASIELTNKLTVTLDQWKSVQDELLQQGVQPPAPDERTILATVGAIYLSFRAMTAKTAPGPIAEREMAIADEAGRRLAEIWTSPESLKASKEALERGDRPEDQGTIIFDRTD